MHTSQDLSALKQLMLEVDELCGSLPDEVTERWQDDMRIATKGIVDPRIPLTLEKPKAKAADTSE